VPLLKWIDYDSWGKGSALAGLSLFYPHIIKTPCFQGAFLIQFLIQIKLGFFLHAGEAFAAEDRTVLTGLERHFRFFAAVGADGGVHFAIRSGGALAGVAAVLAALGLVHEAFFSVEFLLAGGENEFGAALLADQGFVLEHGFNLA